ncbi:hypothetical protein SAMN05878443_2381 [Carnobacterium alterfunditum]|uniref:Integrase catalytic domain-containing protein n=1 Tax=Carnobacterium alterfunditum TaxID=28230 RepID=A0A1N6IK44_9LACT|nr:hypothetical protein SAMN05878443_2381 [Carnobacterium alterfunditum]
MSITNNTMKGKRKPNRRKASDIELAINHWFQVIPRNFFHSITFDCGKEFSNWKSLCNQHDVATYFADTGTPSQSVLNENSNDLFWKYGLPKEMDFNQVDNCLFPPLQIREIIFQEKH